MVQYLILYVKQNPHKFVFHVELISKKCVEDIDQVSHSLTTIQLCETHLDDYVSFNSTSLMQQRLSCGRADVQVAECGLSRSLN